MLSSAIFKENYHFSRDSLEIRVHQFLKKLDHLKVFQLSIAMNYLLVHSSSATENSEEEENLISPKAHHLVLQMSFHQNREHRQKVSIPSCWSKQHKIQQSSIKCDCSLCSISKRNGEWCYSWHILPRRWKLQSRILLIHFGDSFSAIKRDKIDLMVKQQ